MTRQVTSKLHRSSASEHVDVTISAHRPTNSDVINNVISMTSLIADVTQVSWPGTSGRRESCRFILFCAPQKAMASNDSPHADSPTQNRHSSSTAHRASPKPVNAPRFAFVYRLWFHTVSLRKKQTGRYHHFEKTAAAVDTARAGVHAFHCNWRRFRTTLTQSHTQTHTHTQRERERESAFASTTNSVFLNWFQSLRYSLHGCVFFRLLLMLSTSQKSRLLHQSTQIQNGRAVAAEKNYAADTKKICLQSRI